MLSSQRQARRQAEWSARRFVVVVVVGVSAALRRRGGERGERRGKGGRRTRRRKGDDCVLLCLLLLLLLLVLLCCRCLVRRRRGGSLDEEVDGEREEGEDGRDSSGKDVWADCDDDDVDGGAEDDGDGSDDRDDGDDDVGGSDDIGDDDDDARRQPSSCGRAQRGRKTGGRCGSGGVDVEGRDDILDVAKFVLFFPFLFQFFSFFFFRSSNKSCFFFFSLESHLFPSAKTSQLPAMAAFSFFFFLQPPIEQIQSRRVSSADTL